MHALIARLFLKSSVAFVSHYIPLLPCLYCSLGPSRSKPEDTSCNESLLNSDIFSPGFGFGSSLITGCLDINHSNSCYMFKETLSAPY